MTETYTMAGFMGHDGAREIIESGISSSANTPGIYFNCAIRVSSARKARRCKILPMSVKKCNVGTGADYFK
jgi:hypothetical protein